MSSEFICSPTEHWGNSQEVETLIRALQGAEEAVGSRHFPLMDPIGGHHLSTDHILAVSDTRLASDPSISCESSIEASSDSTSTTSAISQRSLKRLGSLGMRLGRVSSCSVSETDRPRYCHRRTEAFSDHYYQSKKTRSRAKSSQKRKHHHHHRRRMLHGKPVHEKSLAVQIIIIMRHLIREIFGISKYNHCGYFLDMEMSRIIFNYANSIEYTKGHLVLSGHKSCVMCAVVSSDGRYLFTGSADKSIFRWDLSKDTLASKWKAHCDIVRALDYHKSGLLVSGSYDTTVRVWDAQLNMLSHLFHGHTDCVYSVKFDPSGGLVISSSADNTLRLWSVKRNKCLRVFYGHSDWLHSAFFMDDGDSILSCSWDRSIKEWSTNSGDCVRTVVVGRKDTVSYLCVNSDRSLLACLRSKCILIYSLPVITVLHRYMGKCFTACFHPSNPNILAIATSNPPFKIEIIDVTDGYCFATLTGHSDQCRYLCFTPDASRLISASQDKSVRIWDVSSLLLQFM